MKVLIISDTHGSDSAVDRILALEPERDLLIHLGDVYDREDYIAAVAGCPLEVVAGNCDRYSELPGQLVVDIGPHRAFLTHGHDYSVGLTTELLVEAARLRNCDIAMFGHTHRAMLEKVKGVQLINPGSAARPRDGRAGYVVMNVGQYETTYEHKLL